MAAQKVAVEQVDTPPSNTPYHITHLPASHHPHNPACNQEPTNDDMEEMLWWDMMETGDLGRSGQLAYGHLYMIDPPPS